MTNLNIAIITFCDADNMGAMLQAIALKKYLVKKGYKVNHIKIRNDNEIKKSFMENCPVLDVNLVRFFPRFIKHPIDNMKLFPLFITSVKKNIWINRRKNIFKEYLSKISPVDITYKSYDLYIVGSDEVWNISTPICRSPIFWAEGYGPAIVYAASMSGADENAFRQYPDIIKKLFNFEEITVRDNKSMKIIQSLIGEYVEKVVDPTLLLENDKIINPSNNNKNRYILVYGYPYQWKESAEYIKRFAKENKLKIVSLWFYLEFADKNILCKPEEFINYFSKAKYIVTTTFHGSIFSILSRSQFVTYNPRDKGRQLLDDLNMDNRIINNHDTYEKFAEILQSPCDYKTTFDVIKSKRRNSSAILDRMILKYAKKKSNNN